jgi:predicted urease superfamily metal-dependent hydrolase
MALHMNEDGTVSIIIPPKTLTDKERKILEEAPINHELIKKAMNTNFNVVYG